MERPRSVDLVDHRRERRRLSRARRAGHEDEAARPARELAQNGRKPQLLGRLDQLRHEPEGGADALPLEVHVDAEPGDARNRVRKVELPADLEELLLLGRKDAVEHLPRVLGAELVVPLEGRQLAAHTEDRRRAGGDVQVRRVALGDLLKQRVNRQGRHPTDLSATPGSRFRPGPAGIPRSRVTPPSDEMPTPSTCAALSAPLSYARTHTWSIEAATGGWSTLRVPQPIVELGDSAR